MQMSGKVSFQCRVCGFKLTREKADLGKDCPKCFQPRPYVPPTTQAAAQSKAASLAPSSAMESSSGSCPKGGAHSWKFGKCSACGKPEGKLVKTAGAFANPGGAAGCAKNPSGKCQNMFGKCKHCGRVMNS
jgi:DNA-directed RNA polymerase subunit RPC12/RpoP